MNWVGRWRRFIAFTWFGSQYTAASMFHSYGCRSSLLSKRMRTFRASTLLYSGAGITDVRSDLVLLKHIRGDSLV
jgi:hypothetical protein